MECINASGVRLTCFQSDLPMDGGNEYTRELSETKRNLRISWFSGKFRRNMQIGQERKEERAGER